MKLTKIQKQAIAELKEDGLRLTQKKNRTLESLANKGLLKTEETLQGTLYSLT
jgi:Fe2+ or Zn2+ uptake regulation protein